MANSNDSKPSFKTFLLLFSYALVVCFFFWSKPPFSLVFDPNKERCLPDFHLGLLIRDKGIHPDNNQLVAFKPFGAVSYVKNEYVIKKVAGVPGDHLKILSGNIYINDKLIASGMPLAKMYYNKLPSQLEKDEIIPPGKYFLMGTNPASDDSRYWGYASDSNLYGKVIHIF